VEELPLLVAPRLKEGNGEPSVFSPNRGAALDPSLEAEPNENDVLENPVPAKPVKAF
jgi:hypothetical protein